MQNNQLSSRIEAYFAALEAPLAELPRARRDEFVAEARAHLNAMVEARRTDGLGEEAAWDAAMTEFGEAGIVGRALWKGWASSGQLEGEGAPLSKRQLAGKIALRAAWIGPFCVFVIRSASFGCYAFPMFAVASLGFQISRVRQQGRVWTPSMTLSNGFAIVALFYFAVQFSSWGVALKSSESVWSFPTLFVMGALGAFLRLREESVRPRKFAALHKQSPVVAEQEHRSGRLIRVASSRVATVFGVVCVATNMTPGASALACAGFAAVACAFGWWMRK